MSAPLPPGPRGPSAALMFPLLSADPIQFFADVPAWYGPICRLPVGPERLVVVTEPALAHAVLREHAAKLHKDKITRLLARALGEGLITSEGEVWRRSRRKIAPSFRREELVGYARVMQRRARGWVDARADGEEIDLLAEMGELALRIVGEALFGADNIEQAQAIGATIEGLVGLFLRRRRSWRRFVPSAVLVGTNRELAGYKATLARVLHQIVSTHAPPPGQRDLLARLKEARDDEGQGFTEQQLRNEVLTLFLAGHETTALTLCYAMRLLALHPSAAARLREEVAVPGALHPARLGELVWLQAVIDETLRLFPPVWTLGRTVQEALTLGGYQICEGDTIVLPVRTMHRSAAHFPEPQAFRPERWVGGLRRRLPAGAYLPFGGGPRACVGDHFARMELGLVLAVIARSLDWSLTAGETLPLQPAFTLRPAAPLRVRLQRL